LVTVMGVGLPGLSIERDLLAGYFNEKQKPGFDYAYRFPGMQRVLQAVGRLIRSEDKRSRRKEPFRRIPSAIGELSIDISNFTRDTFHPCS
jgi:hypothetical protein